MLERKPGALCCPDEAQSREGLWTVEAIIPRRPRLWLE
jgi:hypothetical protein